MTAPFRFPRFFVTSPSPCPYLPGKQERKVFTELTGPHASELNDALGRIGFRRSQGVAYLPGKQERKVFTELTGPHASELNDAIGRIGFRRSQGVAYRPSCAGCSACVSVRIVAAEFEANASQRKLLKRHGDLTVTTVRPWATDEQYQLLRRYLAARHPGGGMAGMDEEDYADMVEHSPVNSLILEYREPARHGARGRLVGACLTDRQADGLSMIYSFFDADGERPGLGNLIILDHIRRARAAGLPYVYLGYWVKGSARMAYKTRYRPIEVLGPNGWRLLREEPNEPIRMPTHPRIEALL